jgi:hypothetical protein
MIILLLPYLGKPFDIKMLKEKVEIIMMVDQKANDHQNRRNS